jgi:hypothetical protein
MGYLYRPKLKSGAPGSILWCQYYVNGRPVRESTGCEREKDARDFVRKREGGARRTRTWPRRARGVVDDDETTIHLDGKSGGEG